MTTLIIVESPAKCKKIESYLGSGYKCIASCGHFRKLTSLKQIDIQNNTLSLKYDISSEKERNIKLMKSAISKADHILLATDDDREGESIAWHICDHFGLPITTERIIFHEITKTAILKAVSHTGQINMNMVRSQQSRQVLDLFVGYKISPCLWSHVSRKQNLSAGRCQTPALKLIYDNQQKIDNQVYDKTYTICGLFTSKNISFQCRHSFTTCDDIRSFMEESKTFQHTLSVGNTKQVKKLPPVPFITSTLQQHASSQHQYSPKDTMSMCQKLYEGGYITYMRTDCAKYSKDFVEDSIKFIDNEYGARYKRESLSAIVLNDDTNTSTNDKKNKQKDSNSLAQEAHEAIRPTNISTLILPESYSTKERKMYVIIRNRTLMTLMANAHYETCTCKITAPMDICYSQSFQNRVFDGWQIIEKTDVESYFHYIKTILPELVMNKIHAKETILNLQNHLNEAQLVQMLEKRGIGRPSTFSSIIDKIQTRGYVKRQNVEGKEINVTEIVLENNKISKKDVNVVFGNEKNRLVLDPLGKIVVEFLYEYFEALFNEDFTMNMEKKLDGVKDGTTDYLVYLNEFDLFLNTLMKTQKELLPNKETYVINDKYSYIITKYGPCLTYKNDDNKVSFINLKSSVSYEMCLDQRDDLTSLQQPKKIERSLGEYQSKNVLLKNGRYGPYISYGDQTIALKDLDKKFDEIHMGDVIDMLDNTERAVSGNPNIIREITSEISIRKSKFGNYIFYQTEQMKKPKFIKLKGFKPDIISCSKELIIKFVNMN